MISNDDYRAIEDAVLDLGAAKQQAGMALAEGDYGAFRAHTAEADACLSRFGELLAGLDAQVPGPLADLRQLNLAP